MNGVDALNWLSLIKTHGAVYADAKGYCIEALEKQIPIKPNATKLQKGGYSYTCPCCEHKTEHYIAKTGVNKWMNYCHICGHRLDWKDVE